MSRPREVHTLTRRTMHVLVITLVTHASVCFADDGQDADSSTAVPTTKTATTTTGAGCGAVTSCLDERQCGECILAINATPAFPHTLAELFNLDHDGRRANTIGFFQALAGKKRVLLQLDKRNPPELSILGAARAEQRDFVQRRVRNGGEWVPPHRVRVLCGRAVPSVSWCSVPCCRRRRHQDASASLPCVQRDELCAAARPGAHVYRIRLPHVHSLQAAVRLITRVRVVPRHPRHGRWCAGGAGVPWHATIGTGHGQRRRHLHC
jgi:hypothetical protein